MICFKIISIVIIFAVFSTATKDAIADKCSSQFEAKGCFSDLQKKVESDLLISDRDGSSGHRVDWTNFPAYLEGLACRCQKAAQEKGLTLFGLEFWGECWGYTALDEDIFSSAAGKCYNTQFKECNVTSDKLCIGSERMALVYKNLVPSTYPRKGCTSVTYELGYYYINASLPFAPGSKYCRVVIPTSIDEYRGNYVIRAHMYNKRDADDKDSGSGGLLFNVQDIDNFQFVYIRFNKEFPCFEYGVVRDGKTDLWNFNQGSCMHALRANDWVTVMIHMNFDGASLAVNNHYIALLPSVLPKRAKGGLVTRNGEHNQITFTKYFASVYNLTDILAAGNKG